MRSWLRRKYYEASGGAAGSGAINSALDLLEARAQFEAPRGPYTSAMAEHDGRIYLDLADEQWRAVEIPPVRFRRAASMLPLRMPIRGGSVEALTSFCNLATRDDFDLVLAWLLAGLRQGGPYPLLALSGEQGSAKTVFSKILRGLIDPNAAPVRTAPREERDLFIAAPIGEEQRRSETELWREFELARPAILGALLDAAAHGLRAVGSVRPATANGRLRTLGHGLRNRSLARQHLHSRLRSQPQGCDRGHHRRRSDRRLRARVHERAPLLDG